MRQRFPPCAFEIVVVENAPTPGYAVDDVIPRTDAIVPRFLVEAERGLSQARNTGMAAARAPVVAFVDDDAEADPGWLSALMDAWAKFPSAGAVGGRIIPRWPAGERPSWLHESLLGYYSVVDWGGTTRYLGAGEWLGGANISFRADALASLGGFSRSLGRRGNVLLSNEEIDAVERLAARGRHAVYEPNAHVVHHIDASRLTLAWLRKRVAWQAVSDAIAERDGGDAAQALRTARVQRAMEDGLHPRRRYLGSSGAAERCADEMRALQDLILTLLDGGTPTPDQSSPTGRPPRRWPFG